MFFAKQFETMWHDSDIGHIVSPSRVLVYMQETGHHQCLAAGLNLNALHDERGISFILSRLQLALHRPLYSFEPIEVRTWCTPAKSWQMNRYFQVRRGDEIVAEAATEWALVDVINHVLVRPTELGEDTLARFPIDEPLPADRLPRRVRMPATLPMEAVGTRTIGYSDADFNRHMNNTRYPDMICDFLPGMTDGRRVLAMSLSFVKEAALGDTLTVHRAPQADTPDAFLLRTTRQDGQVCLEASVTLDSI